MFCSTAVTRPLKPSISFLRDSHAKLLADETGSEECLPLPRPGLAFSPPLPHAIRSHFVAELQVVSRALGCDSPPNVAGALQEQLSVR